MKITLYPLKSTHQQKMFFISPNICTVITYVNGHVSHDTDSLHLCILANFLPLPLEQKLFSNEDIYLQKQTHKGKWELKGLLPLSMHTIRNYKSISNSQSPRSHKMLFALVNVFQGCKMAIFQRFRPLVPTESI